MAFASQRDEGIPGAINSEVVHPGIDNRDFSPEFRHGADDFQFTGEKLLVDHRELDVFFHGLCATKPDVEAVYASPKYAPGVTALRAARQFAGSCRGAVVISRSG